MHKYSNTIIILKHLIKLQPKIITAEIYFYNAHRPTTYYVYFHPMRRVPRIFYTYVHIEQAYILVFVEQRNDQRMKKKKSLATELVSYLASYGSDRKSSTALQGGIIVSRLSYIVVEHMPLTSVSQTETLAPSIHLH